MRTLFCLLLLAAPALGAPPEAPKELKADPGDIVEVTIKVPVGQEVGYRLVGGKALFREVKTEQPGERVFWFNTKTAGTYSVVWWTKGETASAETSIAVGSMPVPPVPPVPPGPGPTPPTPPVDPLKSFRVIFVVETQDRLTDNQRAVVYGVKTAAWLNANTIGGWRIRDQNAPGETDAAFVALWKDAIAKQPKVPCAIVERNSKYEIIDLASDPDTMIEIFKTYRK